MDIQLAGMCGAYCGACEWKERTGCPGCLASEGNMFWGQCRVAACAIAKGLSHCGHCPDLPCDLLSGYFSDPEHGDHGERLANLRAWAEGRHIYHKLRSFNRND